MRNSKKSSKKKKDGVWLDCSDKHQGFRTFFSLSEMKEMFSWAKQQENFLDHKSFKGFDVDMEDGQNIGTFTSAKELAENFERILKLQSFI